MNLLLNAFSLIFLETLHPRFVDITPYAFYDEPAVGSFVAISDYDGDGLDDILIDNRLYKNISYFNIYFYETTVEAGLEGAKGHGTFIDIDEDGCPDIIFYGQAQNIQIYRNLCNGTFERIEGFTGLENCRHTEAIGSIPNAGSGSSLIYCANYEYDGEYFRDFLYASNRDLSFYGLSFLIRSSLFEEKTPSRCVVSGDFNNDNLVDFYVCNYRLFPNFMFMQIESGEFTNEAFDLNTASFEYLSGGKWKGSNTIGVSVADLNRDGIFDLIVDNLAHNDYERGKYCKKSELLIFEKGSRKYEDQRETSGINIDEVGSHINGVYRDELFSGSLAADFDNDGLLDILFTQVYKNGYSYSRFFTGISDRPYFAETTFATGIYLYDSMGVAYSDFDNDGCLDVVMAGKGRGEDIRRLHLYKNVCDYPGDYIQFKLLSARSKGAILGSKIRIYLRIGGERKILLRQVESTSSGFGQQNTDILHFGLGSEYEIERIVVEWQSGLVQVLSNYKINSVNYIVEPDFSSDCKIDLIPYDEERYYLQNTCSQKEGYFTFLGNSCENDLIEIRDLLIDRTLFKGDSFCKDYFLLMNPNGVGVKVFIDKDLF